eukprot:2780320-Rhodomonas_salina.2
MCIRDSSCTGITVIAIPVRRVDMVLCPLVLKFRMVLPVGAQAARGYAPRRLVPAYARAIPCPVLTYCTVPPAYARELSGARYAMSGTDLAYGARVDSFKDPQPRDAAYSPTCPVLTERPALSAYAHALRCPILTERMQVLLTLMGDENMAVLAPLLSYALATRCPVLTWAVLRACYAISGTDMGYVATRCAWQHATAW